MSAIDLTDATFAEMVAHWPAGNLAIMYNGAELSYGELDQASRCVAHGLADLGIATGDRAAAFVILPPGAVLDEAALRRRCIGGIAKYKVPVRFFAIDGFPVSVSPNGTKLQRNRLRDQAVTEFESPTVNHNEGST